jgi:hypothetical protein
VEIQWWGCLQIPTTKTCLAFQPQPAGEPLHTLKMEAALAILIFLSPQKHTNLNFIAETIEDLIRLGFTMINKKRTRRKEVWKSYECSVRRNQMQW